MTLSLRLASKNLSVTSNARNATTPIHDKQRLLIVASPDLIGISSIESPSGSMRSLSQSGDSGKTRVGGQVVGGRGGYTDDG